MNTPALIEKITEALKQVGVAMITVMNETNADKMTQSVELAPTKNLDKNPAKYTVTITVEKHGK